MKKQSKILDMAADFARDLHEVGAIDKVTLREIEALNVPAIQNLTSAEIRAIRENNHVSQPVFARYLNVGTSTVAQWEQGQKRPSGASARLLDVVRRKGLQALA